MLGKESRGSGLERRSTRKLSVVLNVDSGGRKEQPLMLGLLSSVGRSAKRRY